MPSRFNIKNLKKEENPISILTNALIFDCRSFMEYRHESIPNKDTFLSTIYENEFVIWKYEQLQLRFIESIPITSSKTFMYLEQFA